MRFKGYNKELDYLTFKDVFTLYRGSSPRPIINYLTTSDDGVNWIKIGDMPSNGNKVTSCSERITKEGAKKSRKVNKGDIILSNSMSFGKPYILEIDGYIHDGWFVIRNYQKFLDKNYLCQLIASNIVQKQYKSTAAGGVVKNISSDLVNSVKVGIPSIDEQKKIAQFLDLIDLKIETQIKIIEAYQSLIKGICTKLITSKAGNTKIENCLYCNTSNLKESELDEINSGNYPVYGANGYIKSINNYQTDEDSIGIIKDGAGVGRMMKLKGKYSILATLNFLTARKGYNIDYIYYALKNKSFKKLIVGSGIPHIYFKDYKHDSIYIPDNNDEITAIVKILNTYDTIIINEKSLLLLLEQLKAYLLKNMFI